MQRRDLQADELEQFVRLNNLAVPHVNELSVASASALLDEASFAWALVDAGELAGVLIVFGPGASYQSENYRWFSNKYQQFAYVDRIVIAESHRGSGLGRQFYQALIESCGETSVPRICCEVNLLPPNPGSSAFHQQMGFVSVGTQVTGAGASEKQVDLLVKELA